MEGLHRLAGFALLFALGCAEELNYPDCTEVAMRNPDGTVDVCDVEACEAAFGDGCVDCTILTSRPPIYVGEEGSFTVHDVCPDWEDPEAEAAEATPEG